MRIRTTARIRKGKSTGLVTTTRVTHATPAALYAHAASRYWEDDGKVPPAARTSCKDIARQLLEDEPGCNITVILGGGRRHFVPKVTLDPEEPEKEGRRLDGRNLIEEWSRNHRKRNITAKYVANKEQFEKVDTRRVNRLLGLFAYSHMDFNVDRNTNDTGDPSLAEMAIKALRILANNPEGYFLFVEGGRIDHAHHYNNAYRALDETLALEEAVEAVMKEVDLTETLLVVTADHSHVLTLGGLATLRGNPIFGSDSKVSDVDGQPYTTLLYSNGPGYIHPRNILREAGKDSIQTSGVPRAWATHGGEDVPVFAVGPLANALFSGSVDQSYIPHAIAYAACLAHHASRCSRDSTNNANASDTMNAAPISCPSAEPNSAAISSDVMNDRMRNPPTKSADRNHVPIPPGDVYCMPGLNSCLITSIIADVEELVCVASMGIYSSFSEIGHLSWKFSTKTAKDINAVKIVERHECSTGEFDVLLLELAYDRLFSLLWISRVECEKHYALYFKRSGVAICDAMFRVKVEIYYIHSAVYLALYPQRPHHPPVAENNLDLQCKVVISPGWSPRSRHHSTPWSSRFKESNDLLLVNPLFRSHRPAASDVRLHRGASSPRDDHRMTSRRRVASSKNSWRPRTARVDVSSPFEQLESVVCCGWPISRLRLIGCLSDSPYVPSSFISAPSPAVPLQSYEGNIDYFTMPSHPRWLSYGKPRAFCPTLLQLLSRCKPWRWRCVSAAV
ncbi:PREDICTED: LOW QUALITY PROTEIN: uncharacterized protein LOC108751228 [Trachymyrmex septentrionalis]|uniref:LOW QUALITY PROTEIN: uncharacterized protein LOC108751228 n=1 Tax=Trachymyrmex septentrionalis TaxID=34720 RepID=UPI00084F3638|nr:PREDICTED: LOW QUALITY PROTEIN: uncharacterized protein LOC108751228 [Trachymyrmex septentrionalis]